jgi:hypothetical protein
LLVTVCPTFSFDGECPLGVNEAYAIHLVDGFLQIQDENGVFVQPRRTCAAD